MKLFAIILLSCLCASVYANDTNENKETEKYNNCYISLETECGKKDLITETVGHCNALLNSFNRVNVDDYVQELLSKSYKYLFLATRFGAYQKNRSGFQKLYQELSDKHFDEAIDLIKHINKRGGSINMKNLIETTKKYQGSHFLDKDELVSLGIALDTEKELFEKAAYIHNHAIHDTDKYVPHYKSRDPEFAHYFEEKFLGSQAETVRKLSGYLNDLLKITQSKEQKELGIYMFNEYLQKQ